MCDATGGRNCYFVTEAWSAKFSTVYYIWTFGDSMEIAQHLYIDREESGKALSTNTWFMLSAATSAHLLYLFKHKEITEPSLGIKC